MRSNGRQRPANRRPGIFPWRSLALTLAVAAGVLGSWGALARADDSSQQIVVATVYSSSGTSTETASLSALAQCPAYSGPSTMQELGLSGFVPVTFPSTAWPMSAVLGCLQPQPVSLTGQGSVIVLNADGTPQSGSGSQLTGTDLAPPGSTDFNNPQEAPVVSDLGTATRYDRPWRGPSQSPTDYDYLDQVTGSINGQAQPLAIEVFEGPVLTVTIHASQTTVPAGRTVTFSASVTGQDDGGLSYSWTFDGTAPNSTSANPPVTFANQGQFSVTVQVTDTAGGGGVASIPITVGTPPAPATGGHKQKGAGNNRKSHSPTGPKTSGGHHAGGPAGKPKSGQSTTPAGSNTNTTGGATSQPSSTGQTTTAPSTNSTTTATPHTTTAARARRERTTAPRTRPTTPVPLAGPRVTGLLITDVTPVPATVSPLVHTVPAAVVTAPPARRAIRASLLPVYGAALAVVLLLGLGARRELRSRRDWRALRFGS
jgi:hypothetical protein